MEQGTPSKLSPRKSLQRQKSTKEYTENEVADIAWSPHCSSKSAGVPRVPQIHAACCSADPNAVTIDKSVTRVVMS